MATVPHSLPGAVPHQRDDHARATFTLPPVEDLLASGGDARIVRQGPRNENKYGCPSQPEPEVLAFGSSTASTISSHAFATVERLRLRLMRAIRNTAPSTVYADEMQRLRGELLALSGVGANADVDVIFAASGTDIHLMAAQLAQRAPGNGLLTIMIDPAETGSGVPAALAGQHFSDCAALGAPVTPHTAIGDAGAFSVATVACREANGQPRACAAIDAEIEALVADAHKAGRRVLLNPVDVSKTGIIAPSYAFTLALRERYPGTLDVLVDACQFRLAPGTLAAYLRAGFWVAVTGSKFIGGPPFSGALLIPETIPTAVRERVMPALRPYSTQADWPAHWMARLALPDVPNFGLLLRWEAALSDLRRIRALPEAEVAAFLRDFASAASARLSSDPSFVSLDVSAIERGPFGDHASWDHVPTIFPFRLRDASGAALTRPQTARVYQLLAEDCSSGPTAPASEPWSSLAAKRCKLGQPVPCGTMDGVPVSALRLCAGGPVILDALGPDGRGADAVLRDAQVALDKAAMLAANIGAH